MEFQYLERLFAGAKTLGQNGIAGGILHSPDQPCLLNTREVFHIENIIGIVYGISNILQCILACRYIPDCISITQLIKVKQCILSSTFLPADNYGMTGSGVETVFDHALYVELYCPGKIYSVASYIADHGRYTGHCAFMPVRNLEKRIIDGKRVNPPYSFPWVGQIFYDDQALCATFLIAKSDYSLYTEWAVSAAHCFFEPQDLVANITSVSQADLPRYLFIFANPDRRFNMPHVVMRRPSAIIRHPHCSIVGMVCFDVALIKFTHRIDFNAFVAPVCLPRSIDQSPSRPNKCILSSYGRIKCLLTGDMVHPSTLQYREIPMVQDSVFRKFEDLREPLVRYCAGWLSHISTAVGDSGAPYFCPENGRYVVFGVHQGLGSMPHYSDIGKMPCFLSWIREMFTHDSNTK